MKQCKFCQAELADNGTFCPNCGRNNAESEPEVTVAPELEIPAAEAAVTAAPEASAVKVEAEIKANKKATPGKIALAVVAVVVLIAVLAALVMGGKGDVVPAETAVAATGAAAETEPAVPATVPADGSPDDETCKGSYTVTDEEVLAARDTVVATVAGHELTNGDLQVYYWLEVQTFLSNYGAYASYFGLDYTQPLDTQMYSEGNITWQQYFLQCALKNWHLTQSLAVTAQSQGMALTDADREVLETLPATLEEMAAGYGMTVEELLYNNFGAGAGLEEYTAFQELYLNGAPYYNAQVEKLVPTEADLEAYYAAHEEDYVNGGINKEDLFVDVRHILIGVEGGTTDDAGVTTYTEEEWAACEAAAQQILEDWRSGEATEESFAALANEKSVDGGSNTNGGLYEQVVKGQMVEPFENWCFDESRQVGDSGLVKTDFGYHIMYFVGSQPKWKSYTESDWITEQTNQLTTALMEANPMEVTYENICLGYLNMGA